MSIIGETVGPRKPYHEKSDAEKVRSNWRKTLNLFRMGEYSVAIIRAATVVELGANLAIRNELIAQRRLPEKFVDRLLILANGLDGKFKKIILPIVDGQQNETLFTQLVADIEYINKERNKVVHSGEFKGERTAKKCIQTAHKVVTTMVAHYSSSFILENLPDAGETRSNADGRRS